VHAQPTESDGVCYNRNTDKDPRSECAEICKGADDEEDDDLDGEGDTVAEQDNGIDCSVSACKVEDLAISGRLVE